MRPPQCSFDEPHRFPLPDDFSKCSFSQSTEISHVLTISRWFCELFVLTSHISSRESGAVKYSVYIMANYFIFFKIAEFWFVFRNFFSVPEVSKNNSKACFCFSIARRLLGTTKNHDKKYRNNFHFYTKPQASRRTHMSSRYRTCVPEVTVSELKGFTWGLIGLGYGSDSRVCS